MLSVEDRGGSSKVRNMTCGRDDDSFGRQHTKNMHLGREKLARVMRARCGVLMTKKNDVSSQEPCCSKKKENTICALTVPAQAFKSDEHQCSSSRASATDEPNATLRRMSSLQMTPMHSHSSRSSSSRHSCKEVCA